MPPVFPLSSPIDEELMSPFDSPDTMSTRHSTSKNPFESPGGHLAPESRPDRRRYRANSTKRTNTARKSARPGLNLVTNFTSTKFRNPNQQVHRPQLLRGDSTTLGSTGHNFVGLGDLKTISKSKDKGKGDSESVQSSKRSTEGPGRVEKRKLGRKPTLQRPSHKPIDLSPSDRPIVIGMSIPIAQGGSTDRDQAGHNAPITPNIVITPAKDDKKGTDIWDTALAKSAQRRPRPPSSVYSQPTPHVKGRWEGGYVPPVPPLPPPETYAANYNPFLSDHEITSAQSFRDLTSSSTPERRKRSYSVGTAFEEDSLSPPADSPYSNRSTGFSKRQRAFSTFSLDTISPRRRSFGWWNFLLSPLLSRSNTMSTIHKQQSPESEKLPPVPALPFPRTQGNDDNGHDDVHDEKVWEEREVSVFSPITPETPHESRVASNITEWPGIDGWYDAMNGQKQVKKKMVIDTTSPEVNPYRNGGDQTSPESGLTSQSVPFMISDACTSQNSYGTGDNNNRAGPGNYTSSPQNTANPFFQRFVENLRNNDRRMVTSPTNSESSIIEEDEPDVSPNVRHAKSTPIFGGATPNMVHTPAPTRRPSQRPASPQKYRNNPSSGDDEIFQRPQPPPKLKTDKPVPKYRAVLPPEMQNSPTSPFSTQPIVVDNHIFPAPQVERPVNAYITVGDRGLSGNPYFNNADKSMPIHRINIESRRRNLEREDAMGRKVGALLHKKFSTRKKKKTEGYFTRDGREGRKRRRWCLFIILIIVLLLIGLSIVLAVLLTKRARDHHEKPEVQKTGGDDGKKHNDTNTFVVGDSRWLNLTGYPPIPTGISTVAGPNVATANPGCAALNTMWSCALPKEDQKANEPFDPDQPRFKIDIKFQNGTFDHSTVAVINNAKFITKIRTALSQFSLRRRGSIVSDPAPPSLEEQSFLGNTTDGVSSPFEGEKTPFFVSFLGTPTSSDPASSTPNVVARAVRSTDFPDVGNILIPPPPIDADGTASAANLYPHPVSQPLRLFDRGKPSEHYGFYTYFNRSIFLESSRPMGDANETLDFPDDKVGGSSKSAARTRCTWTETRFLVQLWTQPTKGRRQLIPHSASSPKSSESASSSFATDFSRPGSFPYPITVIIDRHGGEPEKKFVYCYGMDAGGKINRNKKKLQIEHRDFGGSLINPAPGIFNTSSSSSGPDSGSGSNGSRKTAGVGFDGGNGGCRCEWRNWLSSQ